MLVSSFHSHFYLLFFFPPLLWALFYHTFKFSHSTFFPLLNSQKQECSCFRWKLPRLVPPPVDIELFGKAHCFSAVTHAVVCLYPQCGCVFFPECVEMLVCCMWQRVSQSEWRDLQTLDRVEQKESAAHNALLSTTLQPGVQQTSARAHTLSMAYRHLPYVFTVACAYAQQHWDTYT